MEQSNEDEKHNVTPLPPAWNEARPDALEQPMPLVYDELHRQAARFFNRERSDHTLQTTALIHEAYLKLIDRREVNWEGRTHFFAIAANLMRRIPVAYACAKISEKRGGDVIKLPLEEGMTLISKEKSTDLIALDEALQRLEKIDRRQARIVGLRYFGDLPLEETAKTLNVSRTTGADDRTMASARLRRELTR